MSVPKTADDRNYYIYHQYGDNPMHPVGPIGLIMHNVDSELADSINYHLRNRRSIYVGQHPELAQIPGFMRSDYRIDVDTPRFTSGEGKAIMQQSVRGHDLFIVSDVLNYSAAYSLRGKANEMTPDEHFQDLIRIILSASGKARRVHVIMPYLYEGRQDHRNARESLDCAYILRQLFDMGISNLITFEAHDGRVDNAVPGKGFENLSTAFQLIEAMLHNVQDLKLDRDHFMVVSPDENTINRTIYYASMLEVPLGIFYRQSDYKEKIDGEYQTIALRFLGEDVEDRDVLLIDDMIVTGDSMIRAAKALKARGARRIFCASAFAQFTEGLADM
ncbi:MAG: ribose-phosphate diphosphokinase, partial [Eubacteriales bacterium]|nr:ribose-phosphate diphosphokinase [Eubacteriales bacterium]